jgi:signal transduction histidine kinase/phage shock protein PspC (stress-responsive transcriptional regulator)
VRHRQGKVVAGVAAGLADHLGVPVNAVRIALVVSSIPFGAGLVVYVFLWATMREVGDVDPSLAATTPGIDPVTGVPVGSPATAAGTAGTTGAAGTTAPTAAHGGHHIDLASVRTWLRSGNQAVLITLLGVAALALAGALWLGSAGLDVHAEVILPIVAIVIGAIFFWSQLDDTDAIGARRPVRWIWLVVGLGLTILGLVGLLVRGTNLTELWQVAGAVLAALVGMAVLSAPWILRLWSNLRLEQAARIRATERADIAAHLHDSVLQTLALIQRHSADAATVARLARAQERQLRSYLYDEDARGGTLGAALTAAMGEVEDLHGVPVELVVTGDRPMDMHLDALVKAVREATWNAVRHASPPVSAYVEVGPGAVEAFVRDHGAGFDLDTVPDDRAGVRESIIGRMERHGGTARIRRRPDGTEVELRLPVGQPPQSDPTATPAPDSSATPAAPTTPDPQTQEQAS